MAEYKPTGPEIDDDRWKEDHFSWPREVIMVILFIITTHVVACVIGLFIGRLIYG